jgi:hypothetical protein
MVLRQAGLNGVVTLDCQAVLMGDNMNSIIKGIFVGFLMTCFFMAYFPKDKACAVSVKNGNVTHVTVGDYNE